MDKFLKQFLEKGDVFSVENLPENLCNASDLDVIQFMRKIIFKNNVLPDFKAMLDSVCSTEQFTVENIAVKKIIQRLHATLSSDIDDQTKSNIFHCIFNSFASACWDNEKVFVFKFFVVLCHISGITVNTPPKTSQQDEIHINEKNFQTAFEVTNSKPAPVSFRILNRLLISLSKHNLNFHSPEMELSCKWLLQMIKDVASLEPFNGIFMEIFSACADLDVKLLEGNLDHILMRIYAQDQFNDDNFLASYEEFIKNSFRICSQFQRTVKFTSKFLSSIKASSIHSTPQKILPPEACAEFSKIISTASSHQSSLLLDILINQLQEISNIFLERNSVNKTIMFFVTSELLLGFLKEVKIFAPSVSASTVQAFIEKMTCLKDILKTFGDFLINNAAFVLENELVFKNFLTLCFYYNEVQSLVDCYKDSITTEDASGLMNNQNCQYCLDTKEWKTLVKFALKSKIVGCDIICFQLALQRLRISMLRQSYPHLEDSTKKLVLAQFSTNAKTFDIFQEISPDDISLLLNVLNLPDSKLVTTNLLKQTMEHENELEAISWITNSVLCENSVYVKNIFSQILKETGSISSKLLPEKKAAAMDWLFVEYFDDDNIDVKLNELPEKINYLLKNQRKIRKSLKNFETDTSFSRILKLMKCLPLVHAGDDLKRLGLSFVVGVAAIFFNESNGFSFLEIINSFLNSDVDASDCFNIGFCIKCLSELTFDNKKMDNFRVRIIEELVRSCPNYKHGLSQMADAIQSPENCKHTTALRMLETQVTLYQELGKCWQRAKKRKSDNDLIGDYRNKLAKIITDESKAYDGEGIHSDNYKILFKVAGIELNKSVRANDENEISDFVKLKFSSYFEYAVKTLQKGHDEPSILFLSIILQSMLVIRKFVPDTTLYEIWTAVKGYEKFNWRLFSAYSNDEEFQKILSDLLESTKEYLSSESIPDSPNYFDIWVCFFEPNADSKKHQIQMKLQEIFHYFHDCDLILDGLQTRKKINIARFFSSSIKHPKVILTSQMLDTIFNVLLRFGNENYLTIEEYQGIIGAQIEAGSSILSRQYAWNKNKVHLTYTLFKHVLSCFLRRCDPELQLSNDEMIVVSTCAFSLEKWVSLMASKQKDFARISAYFIVTTVSAMASVTLPPAIKIHLINCMNHFLNISDSHTVAYLMRTLKPGYQQVFNSIYDQFKKYHKYSGKV